MPLQWAMGPYDLTAEPGPLTASLYTPLMRAGLMREMG